jgi:hypothetical protein
MREEPNKIGVKSSSARKIGTKRQLCYYRVGEKAHQTPEHELKQIGLDRDSASILLSKK